MAEKEYSVSPFGIKLQMLRLEKHLTQGEVAEKLNLARSTVQSYESGKREPPRQIIVKLADLYDVPIGLLMRDDIDPSTLNVKEKLSYGRRRDDDDAMLAMVHELTPGDYYRHASEIRKTLKGYAKRRPKLTIKK